MYSKNGIDIGNEVELEKVGKLCYLDDSLEACDGADLAIVMRVRCSWKKLSELEPFLSSRLTFLD
jgi:hypothetical protein